MRHYDDLEWNRRAAAPRGPDPGFSSYRVRCQLRTIFIIGGNRMVNMFALARSDRPSKNWIATAGVILGFVHLLYRFGPFFTKIFHS